jgi:osmotically-inducible protein OsmY
MMGTKELQTRVIQALEWEPGLDASRIGVAVTDGVVTLTGQVPSWAERITAEKAIKRMAGVQGIANDLEVHLPSDARRTDTDLVTSALKALEWDVQVPHQRVKVRASEGWLTLEGELDWQYQRAAAERCVRNLIGVRGASNLITLSAKVTPMDLKKRIEESFKRHAELEARGIRVQTTGGRVVLDGAVHSVAERDEAERAVWAAPGVTTVEDHLVISV